MEDIKPREVAWRFDGRDWVLRCNNNVLAEVQEINGGDFSPILSRKRTLKSVLQLLAAMLNDYADAIQYTEKQLGRRLSLGTIERLAPDVMRMAILAVRDAEAENSSADEKNAETRQEEAAVSTSPGI